MPLMGYTKLHDDILASSIWVEDDRTLRIWIGFMAKADADGIVHGSVPGLANILRVSIEDLEAALEKFKSPDKYSRTKLEEGRRIREVDGGWQLVTYDIHRNRCSPEERKAKKAARMARYRAGLRERDAVDASVDVCGTKQKQKQKQKQFPLSPPDGGASKGEAKTTLPDDWAPSEDCIARIVAGSEQAKGCTAAFAASCVDRFVDYYTTKGKGGAECRTAQKWQDRFKLWVWDNWKDRAGDDYRRANGVPLKAAPIKLDM